MVRVVSSSAVRHAIRIRSVGWGHSSAVMISSTTLCHAQAYRSSASAAAYQAFLWMPVRTIQSMVCRL
jgi:hypothetical protein